MRFIPHSRHQSPNTRAHYSPAPGIDRFYRYLEYMHLIDKVEWPNFPHWSRFCSIQCADSTHHFHHSALLCAAEDYPQHLYCTLLARHHQAHSNTARRALARERGHAHTLIMMIWRPIWPRKHHHTTDSTTKGVSIGPTKRVPPRHAHRELSYTSRHQDPCCTDS